MLNQQPESSNTPTKAEIHEQALKELGSRVQSVEDAVKQLQQAVFSNPQAVPAPLGVNLDEVAPPPWIENPPTAKKPKLLMPGKEKSPKPEMRKSAAPDYSYAPLMKVQLPRSHRELRRLLSESEHSRYLIDFDRLRVFKMWSASNDRRIEVHFTPERAGPPDDSTTGFHLLKQVGIDVTITVLGDEIIKIEMTNFAPAIKDTLIGLSRPEPWVGPNGEFVWD